MGLELQFPRKPQRGQPLDAAWGRTVVECLERIALMPGVGYLLRRGHNGTMLEILAKGRGGAAVAAAPFALYDASADGQLRVGIRPGVVNGVPPLVAGGSILSEPPPYLVITATSRIVIEATIDDSDEVTALNIVAITGTSAPVSNYVVGVGGTARLGLGLVTVSGIPATMSITSPQEVTNNLSLGVGGGYFWAGI